MDRLNIYLLGLVSFINDIGSKMVLAVLPLFIHAIGGTGVAIGLVGGLGETIASLFKVFAGHLSDKWKKRKPFVFAGYGLAAFSKLLLAFATTWPLVLVLRSAERFGKGIRQPARDALLAASTTKQTRGKGFGIHRALDSGGAILGSVLVLILFWCFGFGFRQVFLIAGIVSFFSLVPLFLVKEEKFFRKRQTEKLTLTLSSFPTVLKAFILVASVFALANFSYMFFILRSQQFFAKGFATVMPILMYVIYNSVATLFAVPAGILSDTFGRKKVLAIGYLLFSLTSLAFIYVNSLLTMSILFFFYGLFFAFVDANERAFVSDIANEKLRATALGVFHASTGLALLPASIIAGLLLDLFGFTATFLYGFSVSLFTVLLFAVLSKLKIL